MAKRHSWTVEEDSFLFLLANKNQKELKKIFNTSITDINCIENIYKSHINKYPNRDIKGIYYRLHELGVVSINKKDNVATRRLLANETVETMFFKFKYLPTSQKLITDKEESEILLSYAKNKSLVDLCEIAKAIRNDIGRTNTLASSLPVIKYILFKNDKTEFNQSIKKYELKQGEIMSITKKQQTFANKIIAKQINQTEEKKINQARQQLTSIYQYNSNKNQFLSVNDGTGFGKSYSVIEQFILDARKHKKDGQHHIGVFTSPNKIQLNIDKKHKNDLKSEEIYFLRSYGIDDYGDPTKDDMLFNYDTSDIMETKYKEWSNTLSARDKKELNKLIRAFKEENKELSNARDKEEEKKIKDLIKRIKIDISKLLKEAVFNSIEPKNFDNDIEKYLKAVWKNKKGKDKSIGELICYFFPATVIVKKTSLLLMTSKKFIKGFDYLKIVKSKEDGQEKVSEKSVNIIDFLSQTKNMDKGKDEGEIKKINELINKEEKLQNEGIKNIYKENKDNPLRKNQTKITFIIDEEHQAYEDIKKENEKKVYENNIELIALLKTVCKYVNENKTEGREFYEEIKTFLNDVDEAEGYTEYSKNVDTLSILDFFKADTSAGLFVDNEDFENIDNIVKNVFSFSSKKLLNFDLLKNILLKKDVRRGGIKLYNKKEETEKNISLADLFQCLLVLYYACSRISSRGDLYRILNEKNNESNHADEGALKEFISRSKDYIDDIQYLFNNSTKDFIITNLFVYFLSKNIFKINKGGHITEKSVEKLNMTKVVIDINMFMPLPETIILKLMKANSINITALSATSGIRGDLSGCFNRKFLKKYSKWFNYEYKERKSSDATLLTNVRNARKKNRNIKFINFDSQNINNCLKVSNNDLINTRNSLYINNKKYFHIYKECDEQNFVYIINHTLDTGRNTFALSRSNDFLNTLIEKSNKNDFKPLFGSENVYEYKKKGNSKKLRIILYRSGLPVPPEYFTIEDENTVILLISSYKSAGTGVNFFVRYKYKEYDSNNSVKDKYFEEDFQDTFLISDPYYSDIFKEKGFDHDGNMEIALKNQIGNNTPINDFNTQLTTGENKYLLDGQHKIEILKTVMQVIGRTERRDSIIDSNIYLPFDIFKKIAPKFYEIASNGLNNIFINSISLANHILLDEVKTYITKHSFNNSSKLNQFENITKVNDIDIDKQLFDNFLVKKYQNGVRQGTITDTTLNDCIRDITSITNPRLYIDNLLKHNLITNNEKSYIQNMYIDKELYKNIKFSRTSERYGLTDLQHGKDEYKPELYFKSMTDLRLSEWHYEDGVKSILKDINEKIDFSRYMPMPSIIPLLKGNFGEYLTKEVFNLLNVSPLTDQEAITLLGSQCFELFDWYFLVEKDGKKNLVCIDAKNWSRHNEDKDINDKIRDRAKSKSKTIKHLVANNKSINEVHYVYVNAAISDNQTNKMNEKEVGANIYFINLFKKVYDRLKVYKDKESGKEKKSINELQGKIIINNVLRKLLGEK